MAAWPSPPTNGWTTATFNSFRTPINAASFRDESPLSTSTKSNEQAALFSAALAHRYLNEVLEIVLRVDDKDL
jgi:hypothetical protein